MKTINEMLEPTELRQTDMFIRAGALVQPLTMRKSGDRELCCLDVKSVKVDGVPIPLGSIYIVDTQAGLVVTVKHGLTIRHRSYSVVQGEVTVEFEE